MTQDPTDPTTSIEPDENAVIDPAAEPSEPSEPSEPAPAQWQPERRRFGGIAILAATIAAALLALYAWRLPPFGLGEVYSNNAYVRGSVTVISPRVGGYVQKVLVQDFAVVPPERWIIANIKETEMQHVRIGQGAHQHRCARRAAFPRHGNENRPRHRVRIQPD